MPKAAQPKPSAEIRRLKSELHAGIFNPTSPFLDIDVAQNNPPLTCSQAERAAICEAIERRFNLFWDSWVEPQLQRIEKRKL